ncbi:light-harvesting protein [Thiocystis minor]|jgi:hypothetical protein|uniref:light-harvesting antenna LH1, alpha subunit n=1 Tax=Thiocystis minor TaxID=61597 RepID=UPI001911BB51|nr:light-harvesting antenna LH1, alpha subunit [Thiocystis minor]MBK5965965.1 light-harvesting protein [Thiocystis minor]
MQVPVMFADPNIPAPNHPEDDWKIWTVINPATWMVPFFGILFVQMWLVHSYALSLPGYGFKDSVRVATPVAVVAPAQLAE